MKVISATKNISETFEGYGVIISIQGEGERWLATFEENDAHVLQTDLPIKILHQVGDNKKSWRSFKEFNLTNEIVKLLDNVITMFDTAPNETKKVLL